MPLYDFVAEKFESAPQTTKKQAWNLLRKAFQTAPAIIYPTARLSLLILALLSLRDLPPSALETVSWTQLIPHI